MKIAIVEDEAIVARRLERMVREIVGDSEIRLAPSLSAALDAVRGTAIDLLFLDLNLNGKDGFRVLEEAAASRFQTVVVSAHHDQALRAFEYGVTDFLAKPWSEERLRMAIDRAMTREPRSRATRLVIRRGRELRTIDAADIVFAQGADDYSELHLADGTLYLHEKTLTSLEAMLPSDFARVHRSFIANLKCVQATRAAALVMVDGSVVPIGRIYRPSVRERLGF